MADVATLFFNIDSSSARTAATDLAKVNDAAARASRGAENLNRTLRDQNGRFRSSVDVTKQYGNEVQRLAAKYNPALNAVYQYQQAQLELNRAVMLGVLTQKQADAALDGVAAGMRRAASSAQAYGTGMNGVNNIQASVGNQFAQLNDVVVTAWGGMNPALIGMQQGMQMVQGFAGQSLPQALNTLRGAFMQLLNPLTLATVGGVAAASALIQLGTSFFSSGGDAATFEERVSSAESAIDRLNKTSKSLSRSGLEELGQKYGVINSHVRELVENQRLLALAEGTKAVNDALKSMTDELGGGVFNTAYGELGRVFETTANNAQILYGRIAEIGSLDSIDKQLFAIRGLKGELAAVTDNFRDMTPEQAKMLKVLVEAEDKAMQLKAAADRLPASFAAAASAAAKITDELNRATSAAVRLANAAISDVRFAQIELDFRTDPIKKAGALAVATFEAEVDKSGMDQWLYNMERDKVRKNAEEAARIRNEVERRNEADREAERKSKAGAGAAARELKAAQKGFQSLRELMEQDSLFQTAEYEKRQAQLDMALAKKLVSEQNYQEMRKQLQMMYFGSEFEQNAVNYALDLQQLEMANNAKLLSEEQYLMKRQQLQWDYMAQADSVNANLLSQELSNWGAHFGDMNRLAGGGYDSLIRLQKSFAAASALINTWLGYTKALAEGPPMTPWMRLAWAGKILAAGMGAVNAIKGGGSGSSASTASAAAKAEPQRNVLVRLEGDEWLVGLAEGIMTEIYEQTGNGRVVVQRDYS